LAPYKYFNLLTYSHSLNLETFTPKSLTDQVVALRRSGYFQLRQLRPFIRSLRIEAAKTIAQAFISCRWTIVIHWFTVFLTVWYNICSQSKTLQHVLSLARGGLVISPPVLRQIHWLPVRQRIHYKIAGCVFQALTGQASAYLAGDCRLISDSD